MPSNRCDRVHECSNSWWCAIDYNPANKDCFARMTNYDRLHNMDVSALADWLCRLVSFVCDKNNVVCDERCPLYKCCNDQSSDSIEGWLRSPIDAHDNTEE